MKPRYYYISAIAIFLLAAGFIVVKYKKDDSKRAATVYLLKARPVSADTAEWHAAQNKFQELIRIVRTNPDELKSRLSLAALYIQEARVTGDYMYYDMAAMKYVNEVLEKDPTNFEGLIYKSLLYLSQHHFADGLKMAENARESNPDNAFVYGMLIDGNVEMGNYAAAVTAAEKMISIRPDMRSYSRISYLREIHGDYPGAIEAMKMAVDAAAPGEESTEWARVQLGHMYEYTGDLPAAAMNYNIALRERPSYAYAYAGLARLAGGEGKFAEALTYYQKADSLIVDYSFKEEMSDIYKLMGDKKRSDSLADWLIEQMNKDAKQGNTDESIGHYADRELAYTYLRRNNFDKALEHALMEYNRRPANIDVNQTVAWVYHLKGDDKRALPYAVQALKTNAKNPVLLCQMGLIYAAAGDTGKAKELLANGLASHPNISPDLKTTASKKLAEL